MDTQSHILVVDDDKRIRKLLHKYLTTNGFTVSPAESAAQARKFMELFAFDLLLVDIMMPEEDGLSLTKDIRRHSQVPLLLLTAMGETKDRIEGLESGADDYLSKPFEARELLLRINNILKRVPQQDAPAISRLKLGECDYDMNTGELTRNSAPVRLTPAESSLLRVLAQNHGDILSREELGKCTGSTQNLRTVDVQVTRLRKKIEPDTRVPRHLQTIRGKGYTLIPG